MATITMGIVTLADKAVTTAGTRVPLSGTSLLVSNLTIQWHPSNAGNVYLGDSSVAAGQGLILNASNPVANISVDDTEADEDQAVLDLANIYIDAANNGDKVKLSYIAVTTKVY